MIVAQASGVGTLIPSVIKQQTWRGIGPCQSESTARISWQESLSHADARPMKPCLFIYVAPFFPSHSEKREEAAKVPSITSLSCERRIIIIGYTFHYFIVE